MRLFSFLIIFCLFFSLSNMSTSAKFFPYNYKTETLDNGLKIIIIPMKGSGTVSYYSIVRTGSRDEYEPDHSGFAHFFEHMMFRGTKKYPGNIYDGLITSMGADANAYTSDDITCYHLNISSEDLEKIMELESDRFQNLSYEIPEFQTESQAVLGEYLKGKTSPFFYLEEKIKDLAFDIHTYKHTTIGFEKDVRAMPTMYDYSLSFFKRYYRPENTVLLITGEVEYEPVMKLVRKYYTSWQKGYESPKIPIEPEQNAPRQAEITYPGKTLPILAVGYKSSAYDPKDKSTVAAILLGDLAFGENSKLYKKLYLEEQKIQTLEPEFSPTRDPFLWIIWIMIKKETDIDYIKKEINSTVEFFKKTPPNSNELSNLKKRLKYSFLMGLETPEQVASKLAKIISITGGIEAINQYYETLESLTPTDIQQAAQKFFRTEKSTIVTIKGDK